MKHIVFSILFFWSCIAYSQQTDVVDFLKCEAEIVIHPKKNVVGGKSIFDFEILKDIDSVYIDAKNISHYEINKSIKNARYDYDGKRFIIKKKFKKGEKYKFSFIWFIEPKKALYFIDWEYQEHPEANPQIWTQGQGKYTSNWLPSIDDMNDKIEFDLSISFHKDYEVIANGKLISKKSKNDSIVTWKYDMQEPMSSYLVALAIGKYDKKTIHSSSGVPIELYYYSKDANKFEPTYRYTKEIFDFLEEEIGVPYPWQNYKQVPVKDFLYAGMENTSLTIYSDSFVVDETAFIDKNYVNVNAHELAHQWFGDLVTETHGTHHWLHEGFATYYALLAEKEVFGEDYFQHRLYEYSQEIINAQEKDTIPLMNPKASSLTFYKKGALALYNLRGQVGDKVFKTSIKKYLENHQFKNVETDDFLSIIEKESGKDLSKFKREWLLSNTLPASALNSLKNKNNDLEFLETIKEVPYLSYRKSNTDSIIPSSLVTKLPNGNYRVKNAVMSEVLSKPDYPTSRDLIEEGFNSETKVRQYIARNLQEIPVELKSRYESLLKDQSYQTVENALYNLWVNFPNERKKHLDETKDMIGFSDKNVRTLWLTLSLNTQGFQKEEYIKFYKELERYTHPAYHFEVRKNAFQYLNELKLMSPIALKNLKQATEHHNWRFQSYCKQLFNQLTINNN